MPLILSLETSTPLCSVALHRDSRVVALSENDSPNSTASQLAVMIDTTLTSSGLSPDDLDAVAVSAGPGSYTGLRIGVATAKGICFGLDIPLIAVNTLELMSVQALPHCKEGDLLCPMLDARRMEVYTMVMDRDLKVLESTQALVIDEFSFQSLLSVNRMIFFGPGSDKCRTQINHSNAQFVPGIVPSARELGLLALSRFKAGLFDDVASFEPFYLKDFIAKKPKAVS